MTIENLEELMVGYGLVIRLKTDVKPSVRTTSGYRRCN